MGRPSVPTSLKILRGNPGNRPLNDAEPLPPPASLDPPPELTGYALDRWNATAPLLLAMKVFTAADAPALARYCHTYAQWDAARRHVEEHGMTQVTSTGYSQITAEAGLFKSLSAELLVFERQFGMTPAARSAIKVPDASAPKNPLAAFIEKRGS